MIVDSYFDLFTTRFRFVMYLDTVTKWLIYAFYAQITTILAAFGTCSRSIPDEINATAVVFAITVSNLWRGAIIMAPLPFGENGVSKVKRLVRAQACRASAS
ncbi:MAG: hypothetical protein JKY31_13295 [Rhodobacteraceae bacterium]|nr:hypothetical protein [Paracoccaceae bacterium]